MQAPNKPFSKLTAGFQPPVMLLDDMSWFLNDNQRKMLLDIYHGKEIEVENYIDTVTQLNEMAGEYLIGSNWKNKEDNSFQPKLTPRGKAYVIDYLLEY